MANAVDIEVIDAPEQEYSLVGGKFFEKHPEKVLAEPYEASGRFGPVTKYRPKAGKKAADVLNDIEVPVFIGHGITDLSAGASVVASDPERVPEVSGDNITKAIESTEKNIIKRQRTEKRIVQEFEEPAPKPVIPFNDVLRTLNQNISDDEIKAYLWYMHQQGNTYYGKWLNFFNPTILSQEQESAFINNWVKGGILFYFRGDLLPAFIYFSENLYERKSQLQADKADIVKIYGEEAYNKQESRLQEAFSEVYNNRLKLDDPDVERRLHLKPYGDFSNSIQVKNWNLDNETGEPQEFLITTRTDGSINWYSAKTSLSRWRDPKRDTLSIVEAFKWWLKYDPNRPDIPYNFGWEDIFKFYLDKKSVKNIDPTILARNRALSKEAGDKLFSRFLAEIILENDRVAIETRWNEQFNGDRGLRTDLIPVAFEVALNYPGDEPVEVRDEKREAVAFACINGSSLNAYQVGVGKTYCAIFIIEHFLDAGHCKRPFLVVPNQVYKQFYAEMHGLLPHRKINDLYNLSSDYLQKLQDENDNVMAVEEGSISILTYEGFEQVGFNQDTADLLMDQLKDAITQITTLPSSDNKKMEKAIVRQEEKLKGLLGKALQKTKSNIEELGFDFVCFDEAHALKNIFSQVKARTEKVEGEAAGSEEEKKGKKMYEISGSTSTRGIKAYMLCSYIQYKNNGRNVLLLTATPFTNSPLEVYSMLSLVAYQYLRKINLSNVNDFFDNYAQMSYELVINSKLQPVRKQVFKGFDNLQSLQKLIYKFMLHKEAGKPDKNGNIIALIRPDKWVLPYKGRFNEKNEFIPAAESEIVDTVLQFTDEQREFMQEIIKYVEGKISYPALQARGVSRAAEVDIEADEESADMMFLDEGSMSSDEKAGVRTLRGVSFSRALALSPYLYEFSGLGEPDYKKFVERSPKLSYIMKCIATVRKWHIDHKEPVSGQVIYMDRGKAYFELLKDYLVKEIGYKPHEIGIIRSGKEGTSKHKDEVKNGFNGLFFDEKTKSFRDIPDDERIKVVIGTSSIKEGLNLQRYGTVLYNAFVDWNPTDEIQLEGRMWRQGNSYKNVRIVIPMMADSMDIFMFQKLEEKTERINSIWNYDGKSNVLKVEEIDPREQKLALVSDPRVIAELEVEAEQTDINEQISVIDNVIDTGVNVIAFYDKRVKLEKELSKILPILEPDKTYDSIDVMIKDFEKHLTRQNENREYKKEIMQTMRSAFKSKYDSGLLDYDFALSRSWEYGNMKGAVAMLKKAKRSFLDRNNIADHKDAVQIFIDEQRAIKERMLADVARLDSDDYLDNRAIEIEEERKRMEIKFVPLEDRVKEFEKLNHLLSIRRDDKLADAESFIYTEIEGCPPMVNGKTDVSPEGIKKLEACLEKIPQTKELHTDANGEYTDQRKKLHRNIRAKLMQGLQCRVDREKPIAIFMGGVPGSGKTTWLKKYAPNLSKDKIYKIDADAIREMLPEYQGWNSKATHKETQDIYRGLLRDIQSGKPCRFDIIWDGTMNKAENYLPLLGDLRKLNYEIFMIYVKVPWDVSRKRTLERYARAVERGEKGRYVPMEVVDEANKNGGKAFEDLKYKADGYLMVDGVSGAIIEKGGRDLLADRGYFDHEPSDKETKIKIAKAKAAAMAQRIRILKLKNA
jgi:hypothetical protein